MNKQAFLEETYNSAFNDELEKIAKDKKSNNRGALAGVAGLIGSGLPSQAISAPVVVGLKKKIKKYNISPFDTPMEHKSKNLSKLKKSMNIGDDTKVYKNTPVSIKGGGGAYDPFGKFGPKRAVHYLAGKKSSATERAFLAHELGHAKNYKKLGKPLMALRVGGMLGSAGGTIGASFAKDDKTAKKSAVIGTAMGAAGVAEEGVATARGIKGLTKYYGGGRKGFSKALFKGRGGGSRMIGLNLASYGAMAAAPAFAYKIRKFVKGDKSKVKK